jgi:hypothetical protein
MAVVSDESERVSDCQGFAGLGGKLPPLGQRDVSTRREPASVFDEALQAQVVAWN